MRGNGEFLLNVPRDSLRGDENVSEVFCLFLVWGFFVFVIKKTQKNLCFESR